MTPDGYERRGARRGEERVHAIRTERRGTRVHYRCGGGQEDTSSDSRHVVGWKAHKERVVRTREAEATESTPMQPIIDAADDLVTGMQS
jgi:hypothetical protein